MADNVQTDSSGKVASTRFATRDVTYSGQAAHVGVSGLVLLSGADDNKTATDIGPSNPMPVRVAPYSSVSDPAEVSVSDDEAATVLSAHSGRRGFAIRNTGSVPVYIRWGSGATTAADGHHELLEPGGRIADKEPCYAGAITAIVASGTGTLAVTEYE